MGAGVAGGVISHPDEIRYAAVRFHSGEDPAVDQAGARDAAPAAAVQQGRLEIDRLGSKGLWRPGRQ